MKFGNRGPRAAEPISFNLFLSRECSVAYLALRTGLKMKPGNSSPTSGAGRFLTARSSVVRFSAKTLAAPSLYGGRVVS